MQETVCYTLDMGSRFWLKLLLFAAIACAVLNCSCINASKPAVKVSENTTVPVIVPRPWPHVLDFEVSSENATPGENVTLKWDVSDAGVVSIDSGVGKVKQSGSVLVSPQRTTKYTLTATGEKGISSAWVIVTVPEKITLLPDLVITGITYNSGLLYYTIKNIGGADAGPSDTYLYDQSNMWRDTSWVSGLKAGEEKTQPFTNLGYHGEKITICADGGKVIDEANEDNNCYISSFGFKFNYDFAQYSSRATWRGSQGRLDFGPEGDSSVGKVIKLNSALAEDGKSYGNVIEVVPASDSYRVGRGSIWRLAGEWQAGGYMLPLTLPNNGRFTAKVGLSTESEGSSGVTFLSWLDGRQRSHQLVARRESRLRRDIAEHGYRSFGVFQQKSYGYPAY